MRRIRKISLDHKVFWVSLASRSDVYFQYKKWILEDSCNVSNKTNGANAEIKKKLGGGLIFFDLFWSYFLLGENKRLNLISNKTWIYYNPWISSNTVACLIFILNLWKFLTLRRNKLPLGNLNFNFSEQESKVWVFK